MSDNWLRFIPTDPIYVPDPAAQESARELLASYLPDAEEVTAEVTQTIEFIDSGGNFERIMCPSCMSEWDVDSWSDAVDAKYEAEFTDLTVTMSCCGTSTSLNDLVYDWPAGFARFVLSAMNPNVKDLKVHEFDELQGAVGHPLRKIWCHI